MRFLRSVCLLYGIYFWVFYVSVCSVYFCMLCVLFISVCCGWFIPVFSRDLLSLCRCSAHCAMCSLYVVYFACLFPPRFLQCWFVGCPALFFFGWTILGWIDELSWFTWTVLIYMNWVDLISLWTEMIDSIWFWLDLIWFDWLSRLSILCAVPSVFFRVCSVGAIISASTTILGGVVLPSTGIHF